MVMLKTMLQLGVQRAVCGWSWSRSPLLQRRTKLAGWTPDLDLGVVEVDENVILHPRMCTKGKGMDETSKQFPSLLELTSSMPSSTTTLPSAKAFRLAGWLPASEKAYITWLRKLHKRTAPDAMRMAEGRFVQLLPAIQDFKNFIESDSVVYVEFIRMFEGLNDDLIPKNYNELLLAYNEIVRTAPDFRSLGPPMYMIMANIMNTQGGFSAFTKQNLNEHYKKMFKTWERYLVSTDSRVTLTTEDGGWFSSAAQAKLLEHYPGRTFADVFVCAPDEPYYGYRSFDEFFGRAYRNPSVDRPTGPLDDLRLVSAPCESTLFALHFDVKKTDDDFIIKGNKYSLVHLLAGDPSVDSFVGGSVIQTFLNTTGYHRWHAPVNGTVVRIVDIEGTYFAQSPSTIGDPIPSVDDNKAPPYLNSLTFFSHTAARQLIFIEADNKAIGLMCFIAIGMTEISTCQATVSEGQHVQRGDELGMFHFGGSSSAMVFRKEAGLEYGEEYYHPETAVQINKVIAVAAE